MTKLKPYLDFAINTAWEAGQLTLGYFQTGVRPDFKRDDTPVTIADREAERLIRQRIANQYPDHAILGEEFGESTPTGASHRWIIDPIDGTRSFVRGIPLYGVLIGLEIDGKIEVGVAHFPALGEMLTGATGQGAWWNGRPARVSKTTHLSQAILSHYDAIAFEKHSVGDAWNRLAQATGYRAGWCDSYGYMLAATGRIDIMIDPAMSPWDCGPFPVIFSEAGGYFGDWNGTSSAFCDNSVATNQALLPQVLEILGA